MKYLLRLLLNFLPREGDGDGDADADAAAAAAAAAAAGTGRGEGDRPDWCPEKFFDKDAGGVRSEVMAKSFTELEGKLRDGKDALKTELDAERAGLVPEAYELVMPADVEIPDDVEMTLNKEDPLVSSFFEWAKTESMPQDSVNALISMYVKSELAGMPNMTEEVGKLGDYGQDRLLKVQNWLGKNLNETEMASVSPMLTSAESIAALEKLMKTSGPGQFEGDTGGEGMTLEELRTMQNDPKYWQQKDPTFIKKVEAGYARLYKS